MLPERAGPVRGASKPGAEGRGNTRSGHRCTGPPPLLHTAGHTSVVDALLALERAVRAGHVTDGGLSPLLAAGTGYTWAASVVRWSPARPEGDDEAR